MDRRVASKDQLKVARTILLVMKWSFAGFSVIALAKVWFDPSQIQYMRINGAVTEASKFDMYFGIGSIGLFGFLFTSALAGRAKYLINNHPTDRS